MAKRRIYDIAKEKGLTSRELLERLNAAGLEVKSSVSTVEEDEVDRVFATEAKPAKKAEPAPKKAAPPAEKAEEAPKKAAGVKGDSPAV
ncbi:MAG: hypothetical protein GXY46_05220, partial [Actinobacteria bacterium]|nr:hypothetical protein [Actinomycetota bacterium]